MGKGDAMTGSAAVKHPWRAGMNEKMVGVGVRFERIRRITGYLVGGLERFNDAKRAEERDRVKHASMTAWKK